MRPLRMHDHSHSRERSRRLLTLSLAITLIVLIAEIIGGILTNSLALIADAGHMASDAAALALSLVAIWLASTQATRSRTYGFHRAEVLAALINSLALILIAGYVFWEAAGRLADPPDVEGGALLVIATVGLMANLTSASLLARERHASLNVRSAFLHVAGDALSSIGVIVGALIILATGENIVDPLISIGIGVIIVISALRITWEATQVLLEATPPGVRIGDIQAQMMGVSGVRSIHDLHVWTVTSGFVSLSAHVETDQSHDHHGVLLELRSLLSREFDINHATIQLETLDLHEELEACCGVDTEGAAGAHAATHRA
jgi:cobalt-zinc-cadmium efflux system protein